MAPDFFLHPLHQQPSARVAGIQSQFTYRQQTHNRTGGGYDMFEKHDGTETHMALI
jgi:hypothetical protein